LRGAQRRSKPVLLLADWIASSQVLVAMTMLRDASLRDALSMTEVCGMRDIPGEVTTRYVSIQKA
jgi:hypothetical protein